MTTSENGHPLPIPVSVVIREEPGDRRVTALVMLSALAPADYLVEVQGRYGDAMQKALAAFRIVP